VKLDDRIVALITGKAEDTQPEMPGEFVRKLSGHVNRLFQQPISESGASLHWLQCKIAEVLRGQAYEQGRC
jgi:hypothetical protein